MSGDRIGRGRRNGARRVERYDGPVGVTPPDHVGRSIRWARHPDINGLRRIASGPRGVVQGGIAGDRAGDPLFRGAVTCVNRESIQVRRDETTSAALHGKRRRCGARPIAREYVAQVLGLQTRIGQVARHDELVGQWSAARRRRLAPVDRDRHVGRGVARRVFRDVGRVNGDVGHRSRIACGFVAEYRLRSGLPKPRQRSDPDPILMSDSQTAERRWA